MLSIQEIRKNPDGLAIEETFDLAKELIDRNSEILDVKEISVVGKIEYEDGLYFLDYQLSYLITLASSRSMIPVEINESYLVNEVFAELYNEKNSKSSLDEDLIMPIEEGMIDLKSSVADNILLNVPLKILTTEEEAGTEFPSGNDWQVMTEEEYKKSQEVKKEEQSPFASLQGLFED